MWVHYVITKSGLHKILRKIHKKFQMEEQRSCKNKLKLPAAVVC